MLSWDFEDCALLKKKKIESKYSIKGVHLFYNALFNTVMEAYYAIYTVCNMNQYCTYRLSVGFIHMPVI